MRDITDCWVRSCKIRTYRTPSRRKYTYSWRNICTSDKVHVFIRQSPAGRVGSRIPSKNSLQLLNLESDADQRALFVVRCLSTLFVVRCQSTSPSTYSPADSSNTLTLATANTLTLAAANTLTLAPTTNTQLHVSFAPSNESCHTYVSSTSHVYMSHVTHLHGNLGLVGTRVWLRVRPWWHACGLCRALAHIMCVGGGVYLLMSRARTHHVTHLSDCNTCHSHTRQHAAHILSHTGIYVFDSWPDREYEWVMSRIRIRHVTHLHVRLGLKSTRIRSAFHRGAHLAGLWRVDS